MSMVKENLNKYSEKLRKVSKIFRYTQPNLEEILKQVLDVGFSTLKFDWMEILLWDNERKVLETKVVAEKDGIMEGEEEVFVSEKTDPRIIVGLGREECIVRKKKGAEGFFSIKSGSKILGVLGVNNRLSGRNIEEWQISLLKEYAEEIGVGIWSLELLLKEQIQAEKFKALSKIGMALVSQLKLENRIKIILRSIIKHLSIERVKLYLVNEEKKVLQGTMSFDLRGKFHVLKEVYSLKKKAHPEVFMVMKKDAQEIGSFGLVFSVPLKVEKKIVGFLVADNVFSRERIKKEDIEYLKLFAQQASISIENARLFNDVERLSLTDGLTGLYTNRYFRKRLGDEIVRTTRLKTKLALAIIDVDYFKRYNDSYGHMVGDRLLVDLAGIIMKNIRQVDFAARYGGDEFVVFFPNTSLEGVQIVTFRLLKAIKNYYMPISGKKIRFSVSMGLAIYPSNARNKEALFRKADRALYRAKAQGRNQACFYSESLDKK